MPFLQRFNVIKNTLDILLILWLTCLNPSNNLYGY